MRCTMTPQHLLFPLFVSLSATVPGGVSGENEKSKVYSIQRGVWTRATTRVYLSYQLPPGLSPASHTTVCYRIRLEKFADYNVHLSYATSDKNANTLLFYHLATELVSFVNNLQQNLSVTAPLDLLPETWNHFCHILTPGAYSLYWQGKKVGGGNGLAENIPLNGTLILGQEQDSLGGDFARSQVLHGDITQVNIWDRKVAEFEVEDIAACRIMLRGNIFSSDTDDVTIVGQVPVDTVSQGDLCRSVPYYLLLPERRSVAAALTQCSLLDAEMSVPTSAEDNKQLQRGLRPFLSSCSSTPWKMWLGVSDAAQEGVWINLATTQPILYNNFVSPFPYGGTLENCAALFYDGTWGDAKCSVKKCSSCEIKPSNFLYLRGLCFDDEHQTRFRAMGHIDGRPIFRGFYDLLIAWNKTREMWLLKNTGNITLACLPPSNLKDYPLGLSTWTVEGLLCGAHPGEKLLLSLSPCSTQQHFMCRSGQCVPHRHRCNMRYECDDGSDEDDCDIINLQDGHQNHLTIPGNGGLNSASVMSGSKTTIIYPGPNDKAKSLSSGNSQTDLLTITPFITVTHIVAVDDVDMTVTAEFQVALTWTDYRLAFSHLDKAGQGARLTREDLAKTWVPEYRVSQLSRGRDQVLQESVGINTANNPTLPEFNTVNMDVIYPGSQNALTLTREHLSTFTCPHDLYTFPFTIHQCSLVVSLPDTYRGFVQFGQLKYVAFNGPRELAMYSVTEVWSGDDSGQQINIMVELECRSLGLLLAIFLPSLLILAISWASFFVAWEALLVRVVLAIGTLLLVFTLRMSNLMPSIPPSASLRLVDIWHSFSIVVLSLNILVHILIREVQPLDVTPKSKPLFVRPAGGGGVVIGRESEERRYSHPKLVIFYRTILLPGALVIFNITFWMLLLVL